DRTTDVRTTSRRTRPETLRGRRYARLAPNISAWRGTRSPDQIAHRSDIMYHQNKDISQPLMFRTLRGQLVAVRQVMAADTFLLAELLCRLPEHARHFRYMRSGNFSAEAIWSEAMRMTRVNPPDHTTLVATTQPNEYEEAVAVAELVRDRLDPT